jgi:creatinine amidohydrolase/Fe(II)-dependent formamide hydrolase-like protein
MNWKFLILLPLASICAAQKDAVVDMELMTYPETFSAIHEHGKTTVLIYNGGTEQRGPHAVLGGHTFIARRAAEAIAQRLGNALVAPVLPIAPAGSHLNPKWPGSVDLPTDLYVKVNEAMATSMVTNGFRNIILMGDHGGGQKELSALAGRLNARYAPRGVHVYFCGAVYKKTQDDFDAWLKQNNYPLSVHAGIPDTSQLMYLGGGAWVRKDKMQPGNGSNGVTGDPRRSTPELGKRYFDLKVANAVEEIQHLIASGR